MKKKIKEIHRCGWCLGDPDYIKYHDEEWGVPVHDDKKLFEFLILEGAQAGLSWLTILRRRNGYKKAFYNFDVKRVARLTKKDVQKLMKNEKIIRNRLKIESTISNAKAFIKIQKEFGSFDKYSWSFVNHKPIVNKRKTMKDFVATSKESDALSYDLKLRGFRFVGSTIMYAHMQAVGMVNDHLTTCYRYKSLK
jgi:DNA-3-methyladenine glycosylase I